MVKKSLRISLVVSIQYINVADTHQTDGETPHDSKGRSRAAKMTGTAAYLVACRGLTSYQLCLSFSAGSFVFFLVSFSLCVCVRSR